MATCRFCSQLFENSQAVRAHLKGCTAYRHRGANRDSGASGSRESLDGSLGIATGNRGPKEDSLREALPYPGEYDEVIALEKRLALERTRLKLRGVEQAHADLDERAQNRANERQRQAEDQTRATEQAKREQEEARRRTEQARVERERREKAEREQADRRRGIIQQVKRDATSFWWPNVPDVTALKSAVFRAIERELATLPVEELPHDELVLIAEGIRNKLTREATYTEEETKRLSDKREKLLQHGIRYGDRELDSVDDLGVLDKWQVRASIKEKLSEIRGDETPAQIEELVDEILEAEGLGFEEDEEEEGYEDD